MAANPALHATVLPGPRRSALKAQHALAFSAVLHVGLLGLASSVVAGSARVEPEDGPSAAAQGLQLDLRADPPREPGAADLVITLQQPGPPPQDVELLGIAEWLPVPEEELPAPPLEPAWAASASDELQLPPAADARDLQAAARASGLRTPTGAGHASADAHAGAVAAVLVGRSPGEADAPPDGALGGAAAPTGPASGAERGPGGTPDAGLTRPARILESPPPIYPEISRRLGEQGRVVCRLRVRADGTVGQVDVLLSSGFPRLDEAARCALALWRFEPALESGRPVASEFEHGVTFRFD